MERERLEEFTPFDGLQEEYLIEAVEYVKVETFTKGQMLFKRGRDVNTKYFLLDGHVDLIDSDFQVQAVKGRTELASSVLNSSNPTQCSCVVKDPIVSAFSIDGDVLDRLVAWSESAEAAFEAEMIAKQPSSFDATSTGQFDVLTVEDEDDDGGDWMSALLKSPLFSRVPLTQVQDLFTKFHTVSYEAGDVVIKEGEKGDFFYVVANGAARIVNNPGTVNLVIGPGQYFGEEALLGSTFRNATVTMLEGGELKRLNNDDFQSLLSEPVLQYVEESALNSLDKPHKIIDVKMPLEYRLSHHKGSINLPLARLRSAMMELAKGKAYVITDDAGSRSKIAAHLLCQAGFDAYILRSEEKQSAV